MLEVATGGGNILHRPRIAQITCLQLVDEPEEVVDVGETIGQGSAMTSRGGRKCLARRGSVDMDVHLITVSCIEECIDDDLQILIGFLTQHALDERNIRVVGFMEVLGNLPPVDRQNDGGTGIDHALGGTPDTAIQINRNHALGHGSDWLHHLFQVSDRIGSPDRI